MKKQTRVTIKMLSVILFWIMTVALGMNDSVLASNCDFPSTEDEIPCRASIPDAVLHHEGLPAVVTFLSEGVPMTARSVQKNQHSHQLSVREISKKHSNSCRLTELHKHCVFPPIQLLTDGWYTYRRGVLII